MDIVRADSHRKVAHDRGETIGKDGGARAGRVGWMRVGKARQEWRGTGWEKAWELGERVMH